MTPKEVLLKAAELIEPEGAWTQRHWARDAFGNSVSRFAEEAECWCAAGAISHICGPGGDASSIWRWVERAVGEEISGWNDAPGRTQAEVVAALRKAAEMAT